MLCLLRSANKLLTPSKMAPRREMNLVIDAADSDSDISLPDDDYDDSRDKSKGKGKGRADKKKADKGKGKAKDTVRRTGEPAQNYGSIFLSKRIPGKLPIRAHGRLCRRMRPVVSKRPLRSLWPEVVGKGIFAPI